MSKKIYWKDIRHSFSKSKGRFLSIFSLMMIGALTLVGLKITAPNMQRTAQDYINETHLMDLSVIGSYGLSDDDKKELNSLKNTDVEYGYLTDVTIKNSSKAIRVFSKPDNISKFKVVSGKLPTSSTEIALASSLSSNYKIGDKITFTQKDEEQKALKKNTFTITGFVTSSEIWNNTNMGTSTAGSGALTGYAITAKKAFQSEFYTIARLRYTDLEGVDYYSKTYQSRLNTHQKALEKLLKDNGQVRYQSLKTQLTDSINKGDSEIASVKSQLSQTENTLKQQEDLLKASGAPSDSQAMKSLEEAKSKFSAEKTKADEKIKTAEMNLSDAKENLATLTVPTYTVYTRSSLPGGEGYTTYDSSTTSISSVGNIFPIVLYLVAAMVTFTTMTRFVDEERNNAGILRALGYTNKNIITKFVIYGLIASLSGTILGILIGNFYISQRIGTIVTANTVIGSSHLYFYPSYTLLALLLALVSAVLPAYLVAKKELTEEPAQLLLAKPPVSGSKILLERLTFIWKRLSFTHKVTARNIFRYKQRMLMTIFGVAGSVALLFAGLGIRSSLSGVVTSQFGDILHYDLIVSQKTAATTSQEKSLQKQLEKGTIKEDLGINFISTQQSISGITEKQDVSVIITNREERLRQFITLRNRNNQKNLSLSDNGIIISEKLAKLYDAKVGSRIKINLDDKIYSVKVTGISEMYAGHFIYMTADFYHKLTDKDYQTNAYLVSLKDTSLKNIRAVATTFLKEDSVAAVVQNTSLINQLKTVSHSLQSVMIILIILSILLGIVILYNLTNINVAERIRELSTIKVLGFHNKEVTMYIYRETIILSLIGILVGLSGGYVLHHFLLDMIGSNAIMFNPNVTWEVYLIPILAIILILSVLGWFVNHSLRKVDMLEALKSVE